MFLSCHVVRKRTIDGYVEEKNYNKYLSIADTSRNSEILCQKIDMKIRIKTKNMTKIT